jgi:hypothetical protein
MLTLQKGSYSFMTTIKAGDRNVNKKLTAIMLDASRNQDEDDE